MILDRTYLTNKNEGLEKSSVRHVNVYPKLESAVL